MADDLAVGLDAGCVGFSTGLIYEPGRYCETDELIALARVMAAVGGLYASHIRDEGVGLLAAIAEAISVGEQGNVPVNLAPQGERARRGSYRNRWR
jgi:N-acyl-D-aspartate/D-glutamate deacylase